MTASNATAELADYVLSVRPSDLPPPVVREGLRSFVNILGCMLSGSRHAGFAIAERAFEPFAGKPEATVIGRRKRTDAMTAGLLNCLSSSINTYDDTHAQAIIHASGPVAAAALALAERQKVAGADFLTAFTLGVEAACRVSMAVSVPPAKGSIAWSQTGICCGIGAAVAAGKLMALNAHELRRAIGIAACQAAGIRAMHGTMCTALMPAQAAQAGLRAAVLAAQGFTSSEASLEHRYGFVACFAEAGNPQAIAGGLGRHFEILANTYKPYPCGIVIHPMIDAALQLRRQNGLEPPAIDKIAIRANPAALALCDRPAPKDEFEAQVSLQHWVAAALVRGRAGIAEGSQESVRDGAIAALRGRVQVSADANVAPDATHLALALSDGRSLACGIEHALGSKHRPMSDADLTAKFEQLAEGSLAPKAAKDLAAECWRLADLPDAGALARAAA